MELQYYRVCRVRCRRCGSVVECANISGVRAIGEKANGYLDVLFFDKLSYKEEAPGASLTGSGPTMTNGKAYVQNDNQN